MPKNLECFAQKHNICVRTIATDAHWQNSRAERHGGILQEMLKRMDIEETIKDYDHLATALSFATSTKNQWSRYRGFAPEILVFGKHRRIAGSISSDLTMSAHSLALADTPEGIRFRKELSIREQARQAFVQVDNQQSMRRALVQRTRPRREEYQKGDWVMVWRKRGGSSRELDRTHAGSDSRISSNHLGHSTKQVVSGSSRACKITYRRGRK